MEGTSVLINFSEGERSARVKGSELLNFLLLERREIVHIADLLKHD